MTSAAGRLETAPETRGQRAALASVCAVLFLTFLDTTIVSVALAPIQSALQASVAELQWVVNGYALAFVSLMLAAGTVADRLGRKRLMLAGLGLFCAGSLLGALSVNATMLICARVVMGVGAAASEPGTLSIIRHLYPESAGRARALGRWAATSGLALAAGPVLGGVLVGVGSWRAVFYFNLVLGVLIAAATARFVPESADPSVVAFDVAGFVSVTVCVAALAFAVINGESSGYGAPGAIALFVIGLVSGAAFIAVERRAAAPILDLAYLRRPRFAGALGVAFALFFGIFSIFFFTALYLQVVLNYSGGRTALEFLPMAIALIGASLIAGRSLAAVGPRLSMTAGAAIAGLGTLGADWALHSAHVSGPLLGLALGAAGLGFGLGVVPVTSVTLSVVPAEHSGMAASATNTARELGAVFGVAVLGSLVNGQLTSDLLARLHALGIPSLFQGIILGAVERGGLPSGGNDAAATSTYGAIVTKVIRAAYGAFGSGLHLSLLVAGVTMLLAAVVAALTMSGGRGVTR